MPTATVLITDAMVQIGVSPAGDPGAFGLSVLNRMLDSWAAEQLAVFGLVSQTVTLTGAASYALATRPVKIEAASVVVSSIEQQLKALTAAEWAAIVDKSAAGAFARHYYYDDGFPSATMFLHPIPASGTLQLRTIAAVTAFATLATSVTFPPGYEKAIVTNLAIELCAPFGKAVPQTLGPLAAAAKEILFRKQADILGIPSTLAPAPKG